MPKGTWELEMAERLAWKFAKEFKAYSIREDLQSEALLAVFEGKHVIPATKDRAEKERTDPALMWDTMRNYYRRFYEVGYKTPIWRESKEEAEKAGIEFTSSEDSYYPTAVDLMGKNILPPD
jgi:hypothetical protein